MKKSNSSQIIQYTLSVILLLLLNTHLYSQNTYSEKKFQFLSFEKIPTWVGVATDWNTKSPDIHLYDGSRYKGHAQYISVGLQTGITFQQFKEGVRNPETRKYMPFFLFDLRELDVEIDGLSYEWAIRIEDYRYLDNQEQMEETSLKLLNTISQYIGKQSGNYTKGIVVLATNQDATPNTSIASAMNKNAYPNMTRSQLLEKVGGRKVEVLNEGIGMGYLRYVREGDATFHPSAKDIVIYESLPRRIPPVSGIITLEPQTPLSHINLLAKNRGTINLYATDIKYLLGAETLINKLVKIECKESKISISEIKEKEAERFWDSRSKKIEISKPIVTISNIVDLNKAHIHQRTQHIGAKASNYALIRQLLPDYVPQAYAIPFFYYFDVIKSSGADTLILDLVKMKLNDVDRNTQLQKIRDVILGAQIDESLLKELNELISKRFNNERIRLRSSTNCEDLPEFNGAGLYLSKGFDKIDGDSVLEKKILQVYASLWEAIAFEEREYYFIDHSKVGMAILINRAFSDEYANGVVLTMTHNEKISLYINSQFGENSVTNPENGQIPESIIYQSALSDEFEIRSKSNIHDVFVQNQLHNHLAELKSSVLLIHKMLTLNLENKENNQFGIDVEFKLMNEKGELKLYIKQARLLRTVLPD